MTTDMTNLRDLVKKTPDAERLMELEVGAVTGVAYGEKDPARRAQCNGYRDGIGRRASGPSSCGCRSSGRAATS